MENNTNTKKEYNMVPAEGIAGKFISVCEDEKGVLQAIDS